MSRAALLAVVTAACHSAPGGTAADAPPAIDAPPPMPLRSLDVATGLYFTCAKRADATIACWGGGETGALGNGSNADSTSPVAVSGLADVVGLSASFADACANTRDAHVWCWGGDGAGALGDSGARSSSTIPVEVADERDVIQAAANLGVCALHADTTVTCWGRYDPGGPINTRTIAGLTGVAALAPHFDDHMCALMSDGSVECWDGQENAAPVMMLGAASATAVAVGFGTSCALRVDRTVVCWGTNDDGQLGDGSGEPESSVPVLVSNLTDVTAIAMSSSYACAVKSDGTAWCWGNNEFATLGNGTRSDANEPTQVVGLTNVVGIAAGEDHACAQLSNGALACWGGNEHGGLGVPPSSTEGSGCTCSTVPIAVPE